MRIEHATRAELAEIMEIYDDARSFMRKSGNKKQWAGGYPDEKLIYENIDAGHLFVVREDESPSPLLGVFYFYVGNDPTYEKIYEGAWQNDDEYGVIHRIAVSRDSHGNGVASFIYSHCFSICKNLRIDTHRDNLPMQRSLLKNGFVPCGIIYLESGDERLAYQKTE